MARSGAAATGLPSFADDSGLCVDALNGMPGVFSARWSGTGHDDAANLALVLDQVADVPDESRGAHFTCAAAVALPSGEERVVEGRVDGVLIRTPRGTGGFGYDPAFVPLGREQTTAEMSNEEKNAISHRGEAFRALVPVLRDLLGG
jgi:XTP/dITP diphosphohydrolase